MDAAVLVIVRSGMVCLSVVPAFTWEAIMAADKVDELTRTLQLARDEAQATSGGDGNPRHA